MIARIPYFSYVSMLHLYESFGWWRACELRKVGDVGLPIQQQQRRWRRRWRRKQQSDQQTRAEATPRACS